MRIRKPTKTRQLTRREFLERIGGGAISLAGASALGGALPGMIETAQAATKKSAPPVVVTARDNGIWKGDKLDRERVQSLLFKAVSAFTGEKGNDSAWSVFFDKNDRVSVKVNCIAGRMLSTTPAVAYAVASGAMLAGVEGKNIVVWDRLEWELRAAGYKPGRDKRDVLCAGTDASSFGYDERITQWGEVGSIVSRIASEFSTAIVNVPVLKDHGLSGVSGSMKNYYGAVNNPNKLHENQCDPYIADLNMMPVFRGKQKLIVCDATTAQCDGGPAYKPKHAWRYSGVIVGTDPVAVDTVMCKIIEDRRKEQGLPSLKSEGRAPKYLKTAADAKHKLGEGRMDKIKLIQV